MPGGCLNMGRFYYGLQIPNIVTDAMILFMPMHAVWGLPISRAQRLGLSGIFIVGFLTLVFDIVRLVSLIDLSRSGSDITYNQVDPSVWTCIEPAVGIVAACLSNMRPLFKVVRERVWSRYVSTNASSRDDIAEKRNEKLSWTRDMPSPNGETMHTSTTLSNEETRHPHSPA